MHMIFSDFGDFNSQDDIKRSFEATDVDFEGVNIIFASYASTSYSGGEAFILFERAGLLYEVNGVHESCSGLEGQWEPEETTWASLRHRFEHGRLIDSDSHGEKARKALLVLLDENAQGNAG